MLTALCGALRSEVMCGEYVTVVVVDFNAALNSTIVYIHTSEQTHPHIIYSFNYPEIGTEKLVN